MDTRTRLPARVTRPSSGYSALRSIDSKPFLVAVRGDSADSLASAFGSAQASHSLAAVTKDPRQCVGFFSPSRGLEIPPDRGLHQFVPKPEHAEEIPDVAHLQPAELIETVISSIKTTAHTPKYSHTISGGEKCLISIATTSAACSF
jgi:hypothetical protein